MIKTNRKLANKLQINCKLGTRFDSYKPEQYSYEVFHFAFLHII